MKKSFFGLCLFLFFVQHLNAQISTPEKKKFNMGLYFGASIRQMKPIFSADISYKFMSLRLMPNYGYNSAGLTFELLKLSSTFYNHYWTGSIYGGMGTDLNRYEQKPGDPDIKSEYSAVTVATGLKTFFRKHWYTHMMVGATSFNYTTPGHANEQAFLPYIEFGAGYNFWKNYPKLKPEETEE